MIILEAIRSSHLRHCYINLLDCKVNPFCSVEKEFLSDQELVLFALQIQGTMVEMGLNVQAYIDKQRADQEMLDRNSPIDGPLNFTTPSILPISGLFNTLDRWPLVPVEFAILVVVHN